MASNPWFLSLRLEHLVLCVSLDPAVAALGDADSLSDSGVVIVYQRRVKLVPDIVAGGGNGGGTLVDVLLANVIRDERNQRLVVGNQG